MSWRISPQCVTVAMLGLTFGAGYLDLTARTVISEASTKVASALQLTAISQMEGLESQAASYAAKHDSEEAAELDQEAKRHFSRAKADEHYATRNRKRGDYFTKVAEEEQSEADEMYMKANEDEILRASILANITADLAEQERIVQRLRDSKVHEGLCAWKAVSGLCEAVGGVASLQKQADSEYIRIHDEWGKTEEVSRREFTEKKVADLMQSRANDYKKTSEELLQIASLWEERRKEDYRKGHELEAASSALKAEGSLIQGRSEKWVEWKNKNASLSEGLWREADHKVLVTRLLAALATVAAFASVIFFVTRVVPRARTYISLSIEWSYEQKTSDREFYRAVSYIFQTFLVLLLTVGIVGDYMVQLDYFSLRQRAVVLIWFSFVGALLRCFILHALPHAIAEWPLDRNDVFVISKQFMVRLLPVLLHVAIETTIAWLLLGDKFFRESVVSFLREWPMLVVIALSVAAHLYVFEVAAPSTVDDRSTVWADDASSCHASEATPLQKADTSAVTSTGTGATDGLVDIYFGGVLGDCQEDDIESESRYTVSSSSPHHISFPGEMAKLSLPIEILIVICDILILRDSLLRLWSWSFVWACLLMGATAGICWFRRSHSQVPKGVPKSISSVVVV